jgi:hypothetical protein
MFDDDETVVEFPNAHAPRAPRAFLRRRPKAEVVDLYDHRVEPQGTGPLIIFLLAEEARKAKEAALAAVVLGEDGKINFP